MKSPALQSLALFLAMSSCAIAGPLPRSTPEAQGISSGAILGFVEAAEKEIDALHSVMIMRHGHVVAEGWWAPYGAESPHMLFSLSKSFTATAIGMLVAEGKLQLADPVLSFFPEFAPAEPSDNLKAMRIHDLLIMCTGHEKEPDIWKDDEPWAKAFLEQPVPHKPGTHFLYNTPGSYMLSAIVQRVTGQTLLDYLRPRLFTPLGIGQPMWQTNDEGISTGGWGLSLRTEDLAKFGQLYLQKGRWGTRQLLPAAWVEEATSRRTSNGSDPTSDWDQGYGYQFWRCRPLHVYRGDGAFGQYCIVMPDQDAVIAITSGVRDMQAVMNLVWQHLLPAMQPTALPAAPVVHAQLAARLTGLKLPAQTGVSTSPRAGEFAGRRYVFSPNEHKLDSFTLASGNDGETTLLIGHHDREQAIVCRPGIWQKTRFADHGDPGRPVAVSGAWTADDTFTIKICAYETPFITTVRLRFSGDELHYQVVDNVGFGELQRPELVGRATGVSTE